MRLSFFLYLLINSSFTYATTFMNPTPQSLFSVEYCVENKEFPNDVEVVREQLENNYVRLRFLSKTKGRAWALYKDGYGEGINFPRNLASNHLPISLYKNGSAYIYNSFYGLEKRYGFLPGGFFGANKGVEESRVTGREDYELMITVPKHLRRSGLMLDLSDIENFLEIPFNYYYGDSFIKNKLRIYIDVIGELKTGIAFIRYIEPVDKLPEGIQVRPLETIGPAVNAPLNVFANALFNSIINSLEIVNVSNNNFWLVKEFDKPVPSHDLVFHNTDIVMASDGHKCLGYDHSFSFSLDKNKNLKRYESTINHLKGLINAQFKGKISDDKLNSVLSEIESISIVEDMPIGFVFSSNPFFEGSCEISKHNIRLGRIFKNNAVHEAVKEVPSVISIPVPEIIPLKLKIGNEENVVNLIRRYNLNADWLPLAQQKYSVASCVGFMCEDADQKTKDLNKDRNADTTKVNYFEKSEIKYPDHPYQKKKMICL